MGAKLPKKKPSKTKSGVLRPWLVDVSLDHIKRDTGRREQSQCCPPSGPADRAVSGRYQSSDPEYRRLHGTAGRDRRRLGSGIRARDLAQDRRVTRRRDLSHEPGQRGHDLRDRVQEDREPPVFEGGRGQLAPLTELRVTSPPFTGSQGLDVGVIYHEHEADRGIPHQSASADTGVPVIAASWVGSNLLVALRYAP